MVPAVQLSDAALQIVQAGRWLDSRGWAPATSGNYSVRLDGAHVAVTVSGKHKGRLSVGDVIVVDYDGRGVDGRRPSAETPLHTALYRLDADVGAVLHTHSVNSTVLGMLLSGAAELELTGYEVLKAIPGVTDHETRVSVPVFENTQDMPLLARRVAERWRKGESYAFLIRGHGLYAWGATMDEALRLVDAFEFLFACELERRKLRP